jgi:hypothetical protein
MQPQPALPSVQKHRINRRGWSRHQVTWDDLFANEFETADDLGESS